MAADLFLPSIIRLLDYTSNIRFKIKGKEINFEDIIGEKALKIAIDIKSENEIDIFDKNLSFEDIKRFEEILGNEISKYSKMILGPRKINDEVQILKESEIIEVESLEKFEINNTDNIKRNILSNVKTITSGELIKLAKSPLLLSYLPGENLTDQYFALLKLENNESSLVFTLSHESREADKLYIISIIALPSKVYSSYLNNPTHLFLKGLDKYGIDLRINNNIYRYYREIIVPLSPNLNPKDFHPFNYVEFVNFKGEESFFISLASTDPANANAVKFKNVFAIRTEYLINQLNKIKLTNS